MSQSINAATLDEAPTSERVIDAVADATDSEPTDLDPLYHVIDPDALDRLFSTTGRTGRTEGSVKFEFGGCRVMVRGNGAVEVSRIDAALDGESPRIRVEGGDAF